MLNFFDIFKRGKLFHGESPGKAAFQQKYGRFENLLSGNNRALEILTELEQTCYGPKPFTLDYVIGMTERLVSQVYDIAEDLNALSGGRYPELFDSVERIGVSILQDLVSRRTVEKGSLTLPLQYLSLDRVAEVGGKAASLGEVANRVHLPVPRGFAVTAYACKHFMDSNNLFEESRKILKGLDMEDTEELLNRSLEVQARILEAPLPSDLESCLHHEMRDIINDHGPEVRLAVRSSATSEDGEASFAGQHSSFLGVSRDNLFFAYKKVVASAFNPRAVYYRHSKGYPDEYIMMSVLCLVLVDTVAAGVMYTRDPNDARRNVIMVNAVWGLGGGAVDGSLPTDFYEVDKESREVLKAKIVEKPTRFALTEDDRLVREPAPPEIREKPCLDAERLATLVEYGLTLEGHYNLSQDVEWALDRQGKLIVLQSRPLNLDLVAVAADVSMREMDAETLRMKFPNNPILLRGGVTASRGKASGLSYVLTSDHNLLNIPEGSILIAPQTSPRYVSILGRVQAIVTDVGSVTGHMASVAREFSVPALVGTVGGTRLIPHGEEITVDATNSVIFEGRVESILDRKKPVNPMKGSPAYKTAHAALKKMAVLTLVDPESEKFSPEGCQTLHDVIRFAHEISMKEMFRISDDLEVSERFAVRLKVPLPMKIYAVDLGGGLDAPPDVPVASMENVTSVPFRALLRGMLHKGVQWTGPTAMDWRGFASILAGSALTDPTLDSRMGRPNYVVVSDEYLNFNASLGYHFAQLDTYCGPNVNDNYITFSFKGGAADIGRRSRRAMLIGKVLKRLDLKTEIKGDMVRGQIKKYEPSIIEEKLDMIGRLLGAVRLLDMVLGDEGHIDWYVEEFFKGNYSFQSQG